MAIILLKVIVVTNNLYEMLIEPEADGQLQAIIGRKRLSWASIESTRSGQLVRNAKKHCSMMRKGARCIIERMHHRIEGSKRVRKDAAVDSLIDPMEECPTHPSI